MDVTCRNEEPGDEEEIRKLHRMVFPTKEEADLVDRLRGTGGMWLSMVADMGQLIVGHVAFSPITLDPPSADITPVGLAPVAIHPGHQKKGLGTKLIQTAIDTCKEAGYPFIIVFGDPAFYKRFGFQSATARGIRNEYSAIDLFLVLELKPGRLPGRGTLAKFAPEFAGTTPLSWRAMGAKGPGTI